LNVSDSLHDLIIDWVMYLF